MQFTKVRHDTQNWNKITIPKLYQLYLGWFEKKWFADGWFSQEPIIFTKVRHDTQDWNKIEH